MSLLLRPYRVFLRPLKLDVEIPDSGKINVIHLQNSEAKEIYTALNQLISNMSQGSSSRNANNGPPQAQRWLYSLSVFYVI